MLGDMPLAWKDGVACWAAPETVLVHMSASSKMPSLNSASSRESIQMVSLPPKVSLPIRRLGSTNLRITEVALSCASASDFGPLAVPRESEDA